MKMNPKAMEAVLRALQKNCLDDMADDKSSPHEKMAEALEDTGEDYAEDDDEDTESEAEKMAEEKADPGDEQEEDEHTKLRNFFKTPKGVPPRPGTAVMLSIEEHPKKKKSIKDLMHG